MARLDGKTCLITGGASGIGFRAVLRFAREGATVYALDVNSAALESLSARIGEEAPEVVERVHGRFLDVSDSAAVQRVIDEIYEASGRIDALVNNAGITADATLLKMSEEQFDRVINVNLKGVFLMSQAVAKKMVLQGGGSIVNTSSIVGVYGNFGQTNYGAAKGGVINMTKTWARELGRKGVRVNAVAPGFTRTEMIATVPEKVIAMLEEKTPLQRLGNPDEIAALYLFLASDDSSYITGQVIGVDGGLVL